MQLVVISSPDRYKSEVEHVTDMFRHGLEYFHVRKPKFSVRKMKAYLSLFPEEFRGKIILHSHHYLAIKFKLGGIHLTRSDKHSRVLSWIKIRVINFFNVHPIITASCHSIQSLYDVGPEYNYVFLSPVFDSISKQGYHTPFSVGQIEYALSHLNVRVYALGGIDITHVREVEAMGFKGFAVLGAIWNDISDPLEEFKRLVAAKNLVREGPRLKIQQLRVEA